MLCFSHDWNSDPLSKTHLMKLLARDNRILWINSIGYRTPTASANDIKRAWTKIKAAAEPIREVLPNLFVLSPLAIPAWGNTSLTALNRKLLAWQVKRAMRKLHFTKPINWVFNPAAAILAGRLGEQQVIYYCVDEYTAFAGVPTQTLIDLERELLHRADHVFVSAERLLQAKKQFRKDIVLIRHGVDYDHFSQALLPQTPVAEELRSLPHPIIGYFGLLSSDWVDLQLLTKVAEKYRNGSLVLVGKSTMDLGSLKSMPNVHILARKPYSTLPQYCKGFDVALIPFPISEVTLNANPLKAREYLAAGLPTVSTAIPEVEVLGLCSIGRTHDEFLERIDEALKHPGPNQARSDHMKAETWAARLDDIRRHLANIK